MRRDDTNTKEHNFIVGDYVLLKQKKVNKWSMAYEPIFYTIIRISGSTITARRVTDRREICRDSSHSKLANTIMHEGGKGEHCEDWRETLLVNTDSADQSSEEWIQSQGEQLQPRDSPEHGGSIDENTLNQSPKDANLQSKDYQPLAMTPAQDTLRPVKDTATPTKHRPRPAQNVPMAESSSGPRRERRRPAYLTDCVA